MAEATADPALDQPLGMNQIEVYPLVDAMHAMDMHGERYPPDGARGPVVAQGIGPPAPFPQPSAAAGAPPGSPQLRPANNPNEPDPDQIPPDNI